MIFFTIGWAMSRRIRKPLRWWRRLLPTGMRRFMSKLWHPFLIVGSASILFTLQVAIFGFVPGISDPDVISLVMVSAVGLGLLFFILAFVSGCAYDIEKGGMTNG
ncbi:MAG: hypothetical protein JW780_05480 [Clostridiales bacterium]|nr:hypothetical protein [Clostridiales bacterium]